MSSPVLTGRHGSSPNWPEPGYACPLLSFTLHGYDIWNSEENQHEGSQKLHIDDPKRKSGSPKVSPGEPWGLSPGVPRGSPRGVPRRPKTHQKTFLIREGYLIVQLAEGQARNGYYSQATLGEPELGRDQCQVPS